MRAGRFQDTWRGNGVYISGRRWLVALRWRWHFYYVEPPGKPGYRRLYLGPIEFEVRPA